MSDFGGEVMAEVLAQRALEKPVIPLIPITNSSQYRHTEHDRDYKSKVHTDVCVYVCFRQNIKLIKLYFAFVPEMIVA